MSIDFYPAINLRPSLGGFEARNIAKINYFGGPREVDRRWATLSLSPLPQLNSLGEKGGGGFHENLRVASQTSAMYLQIHFSASIKSVCRYLASTNTFPELRKIYIKRPKSV